MTELDAAAVARLLTDAGLTADVFDAEETAVDLNARVAMSQSLQPLLDSDPGMDPTTFEPAWD